MIAVIATFLTVCLVLHLRNRENGERLEIKIGLFELRHGKPVGPSEQDASRQLDEADPNDAEPPKLQ
ncbi:hypothetical protein [Amycolatopsis magusensis]|uniref:hypothetical protein n=1 Tax=Amycolatopsis magusensis TaxID=882444 RepID=UPI0037B2FFB9